MHRECRFRGLKDFSIYYQSWLPDGAVRAVLLVAHGFAEHSGRYGNLVSYFLPLGWAIYIPDHRGHGKSDGERVQVERFSDYVDDLKTMFDIIRLENPEKDVFLVGHSMGSAISLLYAARFQDELAGLVTSGGGINRQGETQPPRPAGQPLDTGFLSRDPEVIKAYVSDPLVYHGPIPPRLGGMMSDVAAAVPFIRIPALIMAGDAVTDGARSRTLFELLGSSDKTLKVYQGLRHEIFNEPEHLRVFGDMSAWFDRHL